MSQRAREGLENKKRVLDAILSDEKREEGAEELPLSNTC